jgi:hypothetical protein
MRFCRSMDPRFCSESFGRAARHAVSMRPPRSLSLRVIFPASLLALLSASSTHAQLSAPSHQAEAAGLIRQYCGECHGERATRGGVNLTGHTNAGGIVPDTAFWQRALKVIEDRSMPEDPERHHFTEVERQHLVLGLRQGLRNPDPATLIPDPGPAPLRRLTQYEYTSTMRDLLGVLPKAEYLPADDSGSADPGADNMGLSPFIMNRYLSAAQEALDRVPHDRVILAEPSDRLARREAARKILQVLVPRAFRRPVAAADLEHSLKLFDLVDGVGRTYEDSVKVTLSGVLASPRFLLHIEQPKTGDGPQRIDDFSLANRLSYFLWSSMPDDELLRLAGQGRLGDDRVVAEQVRRMLRDPKARALAENFGLSWLEIRRLRPPTPVELQPANAENRAVREAMQEEAVLFLDSVLRDNTSLLTLFDANYTFVNETLARHYGMKRVVGPQLRRVIAPPERRGGVVTLGGVQAMTAADTRTSPVRRGKWVTEALLGEPASPGFYEVCRVSPDNNAPQGVALRAALDDNRRDAKCAVCHDRFDPPGLVLENFDGLGRWRTTTAGQPIDNSARLSDGTVVAGPDGLKHILLTTEKDHVIRNLTERMLAFALGRELEPADQLAVQQICTALAKDNYRASTLVNEITHSLPFTHRRPEKIESAAVAAAGN